jgi:hypothetical protein
LLRYRRRATYGLRQFPVSGGSISYRPDTVDTVRRAADRILRGESPRSAVSTTDQVRVCEVAKNE